MKITNKLGLPHAIVRALENDEYDKGDADFSVTQVLNPARAEALKSIHRESLEEDASDRIFSLLGQATHKVLERSARPGDIVEKRFFANIDVDDAVYKLSGQIDLLEFDTKALSDFKVTKAWAFSKAGGSGKKPEWVAQLNMQLHLLRANGSDADKLQIVGILRDFDEKQAGLKGYPQHQIVSAEMPQWAPEETLTFIQNRIRAHVTAKEDLPKCTDKETWGGRRCGRWCAVSKFCDQYKQAKKTGVFA